MSELHYQSGFGNYFASEAIPNTLPQGRNSPQKVAHGLYAELLSGTAFTAPRDQNLRTWVYRIQPSAAMGSFIPIAQPLWQTAPFNNPPSPNAMRWSPQALPNKPTHFVASLMSYAGNGDATSQVGIGIHLYAANMSMGNTAFYNADGELLIVPQQGRLAVRTELGRLNVAPGDIVVIPRGLRFAIDLPDGTAQGYVCENYGAAFRLPELGPLGSNGLANARDFLSPVAAFEDEASPHTLVAKIGGGFWTANLDYSPFNVVAWHGNLVPYMFNLKNFNTMGTVSYDHPDPSIYTVLTAPSDTPGVANIDFVIFPPRWLVGEDTFRPPWFHRNVMSEFMGLIYGAYDAKADGFLPGGASLHNSWTPHGPDAATFEKASNADLVPHKIDHTMAFMFETRYALRVTDFALQTSALQAQYQQCWSGLKAQFKVSS